MGSLVALLHKSGSDQHIPSLGDVRHLRVRWRLLGLNETCRVVPYGLVVSFKTLTQVCILDNFSDRGLSLVDSGQKKRPGACLYHRYASW